MSTIASQIISLTVVYSIVYSRKHQSSTSLAFVWGIHRDWWILRTKGQLRGKCFHLMTSPCKHPDQYRGLTLWTQNSYTWQTCQILLIRITPNKFEAYSIMLQILYISRIPSVTVFVELILHKCPCTIFQTIIQMSTPRSIQWSHMTELIWWRLASHMQFLSLQYKVIVLSHLWPAIQSSFEAIIFEYDKGNRIFIFYNKKEHNSMGQLTTTDVIHPNHHWFRDLLSGVRHQGITLTWASIH